MLAEHPFPTAGHIHQNAIKKGWETLPILGWVLNHQDTIAAAACHSGFEQGQAMFHGLGSNQQAIFWQDVQKREGFATRCGTSIQEPSHGGTIGFEAIE